MEQISNTARSTQSASMGSLPLPLPADDDQVVPARHIPLYTGIQRQTHARWRHEGIGPKFVRLGGRVFYRAGDVRAWIRGQVRQNTIASK